MKPSGLHLQGSAISVCMDLLGGQADPAWILQLAVLLQGNAVVGLPRRSRGTAPTLTCRCMQAVEQLSCSVKRWQSIA